VRAALPIYRAVMSTTSPQPDTEDVSQEHGRRLRRNPWFWTSIVLLALLVGALVWGLGLRSDLDAAQAQIDEAKAAGSTTAESYQAAYEDLEQELGTTQADLAESEQAVEDAEQAAADAEKDAAAAKQQAEQAQTETDKANAEADQAQAELEAAQSRASVAKECANAYVTAVGSLLQSDDPSAQAAAAKQELGGIVDDCKAELAGE
jgi:Skp family chaperone for outer membrane proteins